MKCVCCEKEIQVQYVLITNSDEKVFNQGYTQKPYYECCGYLRSDEDSNIYFDGIFKGTKANFITRQDNDNTRIRYIVTEYSTVPNMTNVPCKIENETYFNWAYPFNFKDKEKQIKQIETLMVFQ